MMKYVLVLVVVVIAAWVLFGRSRGRAKGGRDKPSNTSDKSGAAPAGSDGPRKAGAAGSPQAMVTCAHCGVHLPRPDALADAKGRVFCDEAHRLAGPS
jgi:uncharacterized protein